MKGRYCICNFSVAYNVYIVKVTVKYVLCLYKTNYVEFHVNLPYVV